MNYMDYGSNDEDDCSVEDVEFEAEHYDDQDRDLPAVSDLEFIAANAADSSFEFVDTGIGMHLENDQTNPVRSESGSDDDSEDESENEMATEHTNHLPAESSSDSSDSEDEIINKKQYQKKSQQINWLTEEEGDDATTGPLKTKNEIEEVIEPVEAKQLDIKDNTELVCIGEVKYRIDHECVVVIQADFTTNALNEGSTLCNIDGRVLGKIHEIFGPITTPYYTVRWKNPTAQANKLNAGNNAQNKKKNNNKSKKNNNKQSSETVNAPVVENEAPVAAAAAAAAAVDEPVVVAGDSVAIEIEKDVSIEQSTASSSAMVEAVAENPSIGDEAATVVPEAPKPLQISDVRALFPVGAKLYTVQAHCSYVLASQMQRAYAKGSDASNAYDEEVCFL
jgi:rRNA processing protein Gar1